MDCIHCQCLQVPLCRLSKEIFDFSEKIQKLVEKTLPLDLSARGSGLPIGEERSNLANLKASLRFLYSGMLNRKVEQSLLEKSKKVLEQSEKVVKVEESVEKSKVMNH